MTADGLDAFLQVYGLAAVFALMLVKSAGVPIPVPSDVIVLVAAARVADGKLDLWQAFAAILVAMVAGSLAQFALARQLGRGLLDRYGRYVGLSPSRVEATAATVRKGGALAVGLAIATPGVRAGTVATCGLARLPLRHFVPGLVLGSSLFLSLHFLIGYVGGAVLLGVAQARPFSWALPLGLAALAISLAVWLIVRRRQRPGARPSEIAADALAAWHEAACPACLALALASNPRPGQVPAESPAARQA